MAMKAVDMIVTELAVFAFENDVLTLIDLMPGATLEEVRNKTAATFIVRL
jgi:3-oxoacid CoA-transferase